MVAQFNWTFKSDDINQVATLPHPEGIQAWVSIVGEEFQELHEAYEADDKVAYFDAICDVIYAMAQQAHLYGFPLAQGLREVHRSNMSKLDKEGKPIIREDGKVLKGENFTEPDLASILDKQAAEVAQFNHETESSKSQES